MVVGEVVVKAVGSERVGEIEGAARGGPTFRNLA